MQRHEITNVENLESLEASLAMLIDAFNKGQKKDYAVLNKIFDCTKRLLDQNEISQPSKLHLNIKLLLQCLMQDSVSQNFFNQLNKIKNKQPHFPVKVLLDTIANDFLPVGILASESLTISSDTQTHNVLNSSQLTNTQSSQAIHSAIKPANGAAPINVKTSQSSIKFAQSANLQHETNVNNTVPLNSVASLQDSSSTTRPSNNRLDDKVIVEGLFVLLALLENMSVKKGDNYTRLTSSFFIMSIKDVVDSGFVTIAPEIKTKLEQKFAGYVENEFIDVIGSIDFSQELMDGSNLPLFLPESLQQKFPQATATLIKKLEDFVKNIPPERKKLLHMSQIIFICGECLLHLKDPHASLPFINSLQIQLDMDQNTIHRIVKLYSNFISNYYATSEKRPLGKETTFCFSQIISELSKLNEYTNKDIYKACFSELFYILCFIKDLSSEINISPLKKLLKYYIDNGVKFLRQSHLLFLLELTMEALVNDNSQQHLNCFLKLLPFLHGYLFNAHKCKALINRVLEDIGVCQMTLHNRSELEKESLKVLEFYLIKLGENFLLQLKKTNLLPSSQLEEIEIKLLNAWELFLEINYKHEKNESEGMVYYKHTVFFNLLTQKICLAKSKNTTQLMALLNTYLLSIPELNEVFSINVAHQCFHQGSITAKYFANVLISALKQANDPTALLGLLRSNSNILAEVMKDSNLLVSYFEVMKKTSPSISKANFRWFIFYIHALKDIIHEGTFTDNHIQLLAFIFEKRIHKIAELANLNQLDMPAANQGILQTLNCKSALNQMMTQKDIIMSLHLNGDFQKFALKGWQLDHVKLSGAKFYFFNDYVGQETASIEHAHIYGSFNFSQIAKFKDVDAEMVGEDLIRCNFYYNSSGQHSNEHTSPTAKVLATYIFNHKLQRLKEELLEKDKIIAELKTPKLPQKRKVEEIVESHKRRKSSEDNREYSSKAGLLCRSIFKYKPTRSLNNPQILSIEEIDKLLGKPGNNR